MKKYLILAAAVIMQMGMGATYSWAVFIKPLKDSTGLMQGTLQLPFSLFYFVFPLTLIFSSRITARLGTKKSALLGGIFFGSGWILAQFGSLHFLFTIIGIGILGGIGVGLVYLVPVTVGLSWFPHQKGLVTGITVAGFGGGAALISQFAGWSMKIYDFSPYKIFWLLGIGFFIVIVAGSFLMQMPKGITTKNNRPVKFREIISRKIFRLLYFAMFTGLAAGLSVNANLKELNGVIDLEAGIIAVALFAIANALGRIIWGIIFDRMSSESSIMLNLFCQAIVLISMGLIFELPYGLPIFAFLVGFNYGGVLVLYASTVAVVWGVENIHKVYGLLFSVHLIATFVPSISGYIYDFTGSFQIPFVIIGIMLLLAIFYIQKNKRQFKLDEKK